MHKQAAAKDDELSKVDGNGINDKVNSSRFYPICFIWCLIKRRLDLQSDTSINTGHQLCLSANSSLLLIASQT